MALWQFITIAALIGVLFIYLMVLTNRVGATNALLKRIEEALVSPQLATGNVRAMMARSAVGMPVTAAVPPPDAQRLPMAVQSPTAELIPMTARRPTSEPVTQAGAPEITGAPEVPDSDRRVSFLTVRDLKVIARSGRRSNDGTVGMSPLFREAMERKRADREDIAPASPEMGAPTPAERDTGAANEYAEAAAITTAADEHAVAESPAETIICATDSRADAVALSVISAPNVESVPEAPTPDVLTPAANDEARSKSPPATFATDDGAHNEAPPSTFASNDESALEAAAAAVAANDESPAEPEPPTAATEPRPVAAAQPVDEDLLERRRKRAAQLILSAQRRRRRTRGF